ncbi:MULTISPECIES: type II toxin-antitoxin system VapC family toxin [Limnospira]|jgi:PIN domain nuclease of toxin-antitoxin system|uniref:type II toxin-antitoxin system VapC family toxin n=1 Tax=Limnospira TaxID=2596745 RepID=UPI0028E12533|nr:type II toxin-antitoxin system VapC family toxin [Limnospira sp. PMC 289.06]MDT9297774.1 type II toxin-antitoxin system VapC family toxin [Arthrospira platensis PCC 7345]
MRLLLDTHIFIWLIDGNPKLSQTARQAIEDESNTLHLSIVSLWEITIKTSLGKLELAIPLEQIVINFILPSDIEILPIHLPHLLILQTLPFHHRDPFDRLLISQAKSETLTLLSEDGMFEQYEVEILW